MGLVWLSSPVQGRRKKNIPFPISQVRSIIHFRDIGRITFTTIQNNRNRPGILIFRAKLHTSEFVSTPSCATMKPNRWHSVKGNRNRSIERFQDMQTRFLSTKTPKKTAHFSAVLRPAMPGSGRSIPTRAHRQAINPLFLRPLPPPDAPRPGTAFPLRDGLPSTVGSCLNDPRP